MELRPDLFGHEGHRVLWAAAALVCSFVICVTLIITLACPWYYMDYSDATVTGDTYYEFRWEGMRIPESKVYSKEFYQWDEKELDGFGNVQSIFQATLVFVLFAFFHGLFIFVPLLILVIPLPGDAQFNIGSLQWGLSGIRLVAGIAAMIFCGCMLFWLALSWFVFFGVTDAFNDTPFCDKTSLMSDGPCQHFSGVDDDNPYGPSAGWVFAFFTFFYLTYLCICLVMTLVSEGASIPSKFNNYGNYNVVS